MRTVANLPRVSDGFSLIELMVVLCLLGILISLAYPSYQHYQVRANRADVQAEMLVIAARLKQFHMLQGPNARASLQGLGVPNRYPDAANAHYNLNLSYRAQQWTLNAMPITGTMQHNNGVVVLNSHGQNCWNEGIECSPNSSTSWSVR